MLKVGKTMTNNEVAELLRAVAAAYQLQGEARNKFRIVAYQRAADAVEHASSELKDLWDEGKLDDIPGIGKSIAEHLDEIFKKGSSKHFEEVMKGLPSQIFKLMEIPGIGVKTAYKLVSIFQSEISEKDPVESLEKLAKEGKIRNLEGFGEESEKDIIRSISEIKGRTKRHLLPYAAEIAREIASWMLQDTSVKKADPLGSLRRHASTIADIDIAVSSDNPLEALEHFTKYPKTQRILEKGTRTASIIIPGNVQVDMMAETPDAYGALLQHFTGSKHHNIALREYALKKDLSLSDYGIYVKRGEKKTLRKISTEEKFYNFLEMDFIPPELREDSGEIAAAIKHNLPKLVELRDINADLQMHSDFDIETSHDLGASAMEEHIKKANELGYEYIAFTEHNPSQSGHSEGRILDLIKKKKDRIDKINSSYVKDIKSRGLPAGRQVSKVFNSLEIDILPSGKLPVPEKGLELLDFALIAIHTSFRQPKGEMTKRILSAFSHPKVKIFAHPTTRKLGVREGIEVDWEKIFDYCLVNNKWLEINSDPMRLDLPDFLVREGIKLGVKFSLGTDAHHIDHMDNMEYGLSVARRGWAEKKDIVNTRTLEEFEKGLRN